MRVVHIIGRMNVGGPAVIVAELLTHLEADVHLLVGEVDADEADYLELRAPTLEVTRIPGLGRAVRPTDDIRALAGLTGELRRLQPDIVHTHTAKAGTLGRAAAVAAGARRRVHSFHGHLLHGYFSNPVTRGITVAERGLATVTDRLVAVGEGVRDELLAARIGRTEQFVVIAPGVSSPGPAPQRHEARATLNLPLDASVVVFVARLTGVKRPDRMVAVAQELTGATFVVVGDGPLRATLEASAPANVRFLGWRADMENVYAAADLILLTSANEGMPLTLIEAALHGIPAVSTDVGSVGEVVINGRTGLTVADDVSCLVDAVRGLLSNHRQRQAMGRAAREFAEDAFSVERMTDAHMALYRSLMAGSPRRRHGPLRGRRP